LPSRMVHLFIDTVFFSKRYWLIHARMDSMYPVLGRVHRIMFHDPASCYLIAQGAYPKDSINATKSAWLHIAVDYACSANPSLRKTLESMASEELRIRKRRKRIGFSDPQIERQEQLILQEKLRTILGISWWR